MLTCEWCGAEFEATNKRGPQPRFCKPSHRRRAHEFKHGHGERARRELVIVGTVVIDVDLCYYHWSDGIVTWTKDRKF